MKDKYDEAVAFIRSKIQESPTVLVIAGSGLGGLADIVESPVSVPYSEIPNFPQSTVHGHQSRLVFGRIGASKVVVMCGRFHSYEGYDLPTTAFPVRVFFLLGVKTLIVTNAAGGLNPSLKPGDIAVVSDHINLPGMAGKHPLVGPNDDRFGPRFPPMDKAYSVTMRDMVKSIGTRLGITHLLRFNAVYAFVSGPSYETPHEALLLRNAGADCVGMSTVPEVIVAAHCGMQVLCLSLITNNVILPGDGTTRSANHQEVLEAAKAAATVTQSLVHTVISELST